MVTAVALHAKLKRDGNAVVAQLPLLTNALTYAKMDLSTIELQLHTVMMEIVITEMAAAQAAQLSNTGNAQVVMNQPAMSALMSEVMVLHLEMSQLLIVMTETE